MNKFRLQEEVLKVIKDRISNKTVLANMLVDLLCIEKEAVYRRLRGEVAFTFVEIAMIANEFGISLDSIISSSLSSKSKPFQLKLVNFIEPTEVDYAMMEHYVAILKAGRDDPNSELIDCTNTLPLSLCYGYKYFAQLQLFRSLYQSGGTNKIKSFNQVRFSAKTELLQKADYQECKYIKNKVYIFDPLLFQYIINDINYYHSINLINEQDKMLLKNDLKQIANDLEQLAIRGYDIDTGNRINIYIASINMDVSYWNVRVDNYRISMIKAFILSNFTSLEEESYLILKQRVDAVLRSSTLISVSSEIQRIAFFARQREIIDTL